MLNETRNLFSLMLLIGALACAPSSAADAITMVDTHSGLADSSRELIQKMYDSVAFDHDLNMAVLATERGIPEPLYEGLRSGTPAVRLSALSILERLAVQRALPDAKDGERLEAAIDSCILTPSSDTERTVLQRYADRVRWNRSVQRIAESSRRAEFLANLLDRRNPDEAYYSERAVDYLVELGPEGLRVLGTLEEEAKARSISDELLGRARLGRLKIAITHALKSQDGPADAVTRLVVAARRSGESRMDVEFRIWAVERLAARKPESAPHLRNLAMDPSIDERVRRAAQLALRKEASRFHWAW